MSLHGQPVRIPVQGFHLEGVLSHGDQAGQGAGVVVLHPHPQMGGCMHNNVVEGLVRAFAGAGYVTLAFNFRGVQGSGGRQSEGEGEVEDVLAAVEHLRLHPQVRSGGVAVAGYSFGAWAGYRASLRSERIVCLGGVAPPTLLYGFETLTDYTGAFFFVCGDRDRFCPLESHPSLLRGPPELRGGDVIAGADHFFWSRESEAAQALCRRFSAVLPPRLEVSA